MASQIQQQQQPQVVFYGAPPKNTDLLRFPKKTAFTFGIIKIILGSISIGLGIANVVLNVPVFGVNIWSGVIVCVTGSFAIPSALKKNKYMIITYMVLCIIASVTTGVALIGSSTSLSDYIKECKWDYWRYWSYCKYRDANYSLLGIGILINLTVMVLCIIGSGLCCRAICCCSNNGQQSQIYFGMTPTAASTQQYTIPTNQPATQQMMVPSSIGMPLSGQMMTSPGQFQVVMAASNQPQQMMSVPVVNMNSSIPNPQNPIPKDSNPPPFTMPQSVYQNETMTNFTDNMNQNIPLVGSNNA